MARTSSEMLALGTRAPDFSLQNVMADRPFSLADCKGKNAVLIMFICNHCPFVVHVLPELKRLQDDYSSRGVQMIAINSNDVENYPEDGPSNMRELALDQGWTFPFLFDSTQEVARDYKAACTPDIYLFDSHFKLAYRGQMDNSRPSNSEPVNGKDLRAALNAVLANKPVSPDQKPSIGCSIKWKRE